MTLADFGAYTNRVRRAAAGNRDAELAQNAYSRFLAMDRGTRSLDALNRGMSRNVERFGSQYGRRGLRNSGIFEQAQADYASDWARQQQDINSEVTQALRQADLGDAASWANYGSQVLDAEEQKYLDILATASQLRSVTGG